MNNNNSIRYFAALFLLLLFVLGNSPKQWLHRAFADHQDFSPSLSANKNKIEVTQAGIHCQCDQFVVESVYTAPENLITYIALVNYPAFASKLTGSVIFKTHFLPELRGPPVVG